ncbi:hypothetical protein SARC_06169 [Sphaeroforma arctica JP610]|uniref:PEHE domain-containing protein n=1 Tax=Sphaeroforma arctica JP610 TaxID=667725 RepID=A0A0L0FZV4_9EUKA|nr:hypothetical protein SARC_06169 [Sphaeroforma arctica JP610]KNC81503.1 hypothetical protein SARC_06169 [Sphaeroforma arctica JP610]|eukprot:XP_014155405.1 hypothetical protein SARC_06169 [Sphaeroforma arctica JP610]
MDPKNKQTIIDVDAEVIPEEPMKPLSPSMEGLRNENKRLRLTNESYSNIMHQLRDAQGLIKNLKDDIEAKDKKIARLERRFHAKERNYNDNGASSEEEEEDEDEDTASVVSTDDTGDDDIEVLSPIQYTRGHMKAPRGRMNAFTGARGGRHGSSRTRSRAQIRRQALSVHSSAENESPTVATARGGRRKRYPQKMPNGSGDMDVGIDGVSNAPVQSRTESRVLRGRGALYRSNVDDTENAKHDSTTIVMTRGRGLKRSLPRSTQSRTSTRTRTRVERSGAISSGGVPQHTHTDEDDRDGPVDDSNASDTGSDDEPDSDDGPGDSDDERERERPERERQEFEKWDSEWNPLFRSAIVPVDPAMVPTVDAAEKAARKEAIPVPNWRVVGFESNAIDDRPGHIEDMSDAAYDKRHRKYEALEKRRKRTDHERLLLDQQLITTQAGVKEADQARGNTEQNILTDVYSLFPDPYTNLKAIEVTLKLPYVAWGASVPKELCYRLQEIRHETAHERAKRCQAFALPVSGSLSFQTEMMAQKAQLKHKRTRMALAAPIQANPGRTRTRVNSTNSVASNQSRGRTLTAGGSASKRLKRDLSQTKRRTSSRLHSAASAQSEGAAEAIPSADVNVSPHTAALDTNSQKAVSIADKDKNVGPSTVRGSMRTQNSSVPPVGKGENEIPHRTRSRSGRKRTPPPRTRASTRTRSQTPSHALNASISLEPVPPLSVTNTARKIEDMEQTVSQSASKAPEAAVAQPLALRSSTPPLSPSPLPTNCVWRARSIDGSMSKPVAVGKCLPTGKGNKDEENESQSNAAEAVDSAVHSRAKEEVDKDDDMPPSVSISSLITGLQEGSKKSADQAPLLLRFKRVTPVDAVE